MNRRAVLLLALVSMNPWAWAQAPAEAGLPGSNLRPGQKGPEINGVDQFGKPQDFATLQGPNGLLLLFFRSADW